MRIISQDGTIDIPYDRYVISTNMHDSKEIIAWSDVNISSDDCIVLANYSSSEKSFKAMEMVRKNYGDFIRAQSSERYFAFNPPKIFQFPKDDEIEV